VLYVVQGHEDRGGGRQGLEHPEARSTHRPFVDHLVAPVGLESYQAQGSGLRRRQTGNNPLVHRTHEVGQPDPWQPGFGGGGP
jgi:hypothetical protein